MPTLRTYSKIIGVLVLALSSAFTQAQADTNATTRSYADGQVRWRCQWQAGMLEGEATQYYPDGTEMMKGTYKEGLKHGLFVHFGKDGSLLLRELFVHGTRKWSSNKPENEAVAPIALLNAPRRASLDPANTGTLEDYTNAFLAIIPFSSLDRLSKRMGMVVGTSSEDGDLNGRRGEVFVNIMKKSYGAHLSVAQSFVTGRSFARDRRGNDVDSFQAEQMTLSAVGSFRLVDRPEHLAFIRAGYARSIDSEPDDMTPVRGITGGQRPADFASTFLNASSIRVSANHFHWKGDYLSQVDLGVDWVNYDRTEMGSTRTSSTSDMVLRLNAGIARQWSSWYLAAETANSINTGAGPSIYTLGGTATYYTGATGWVSLNSMLDQNAETSFTLSFGSWLWRLN